MRKVSQFLSMICIAFIFCFATIVKAQSLVASVDRNVISIADTFTLQLEAKDLGSLNQPDFAILDTDFEILGKNVSHNIQNINGVSSQSVVWQLQLKAKKLGEIEIPVFKLDDVSSQNIIIKVQQVEVESADNLDFKLQLVANKKQVKVNEQVLLTLKFFYAKYVNNLQNTELDIANTKIIRLENREYETQIQGKTYGVFELNYALFPSAAGIIDIPAQQISVRMGRSSVFNGRQGKTVTLQSKALQIPITELANSQNVIVADDLVLTENWPTQTQELKVGDSLTREINLKINGVLAETIPAIAMPEMSGVKIYPEAADKKEQKNTNGIFVKRSRKFAIVPTQAGTLEIPAIEYQWWNAIEQKMETASLPAREIQVIAAPSSKVSTPPQINDQLKKSLKGDNLPQPVKVKLEKVYVENPVNYWLIGLNIVSLLIIMVLSVLLYLHKKKARKPPLEEQYLMIDQEQQLFDALINTCQKEDRANIYRQLDRWSSCLNIKQWSQSELKVQVDSLQRGLYATSPSQSAWSKDSFIELLQKERKQSLKKHKLDVSNHPKNSQFTLYPDQVAR